MTWVETVIGQCLLLVFPAGLGALLLFAPRWLQEVGLAWFETSKVAIPDFVKSAGYLIYLRAIGLFLLCIWLVLEGLWLLG